MRCLFIIQGEGRGHMTQALALRDLLAAHGHTLSAVLVGHSSRRAVPAFFSTGIQAPIRTFQSPNFVADGANRSIQLLPTVRHTLRHTAAYRASLDVIDQAVADYRPDLLVNFYEPLGGLYNIVRKPGVPLVSIGHQYMFFHPTYPFPPDQRMQRWGVQQFTKLTSLGASARLALSFYRAETLPDRNLIVVPPVLRKAVFDQPLDVEEDFILIYLLNAGYADDIMRWNERRPHVQLHCFWDNQQHDAVYQPSASLTFHQLSGVKFLDKMARCRAMVCTAGFESVSEAMYLGKPVLMVPVEGHFEQQCNALDAQNQHAGRYSPTFDLDRLQGLPPRHAAHIQRFRDWVHEGEPRFMETLERVAEDERAVAKAA
ncbi:MAG: glycosyltransferase family protein [Bacteroidota bacterium]